MFDSGEDVGAVIAQYRERLRKLDDRVADVGALTAQVVRGSVDKRTQRADTTFLGGLQSVGELFQLPPQVIPLHGDGGAVLRNDRTIGQHRSAGVGRGEL